MFRVAPGRVSAAVAAACTALVLGAAASSAATSYPNDPFFTQGDQWALAGATSSINAPQAWCASTGAGIVIADIDTGADFNHPDLSGKLIGGARFTDGTGNQSAGGVQDDNGHGTMTTGIMVADTNNNTGIAAVAPDARALVVKVLNSGGGGYDNDVSAGIEWAWQNGANVINLSLGPDIPFTSSITVNSGIPN
ncbi:MAG: S8 family serine peptidase, partial [Candidatus Dormibacteraeota bacterium]|nr:S8 family serine peptidase [Candidatus Dormibacteraeota bacterium]